MAYDFFQEICKVAPKVEYYLDGKLLFPAIGRGVVTIDGKPAIVEKEFVEESTNTMKIYLKMAD